MLCLEDELRPAESASNRRNIFRLRQRQKDARRFDAAKLAQHATGERHCAEAEGARTAQTRIMDAIANQQSVVSTVDQISACASRIARVIGDELDQR